MQHCRIFIFLAVFLPAAPLLPWGSHFLITDRSLAHPSMAFTQNKVKVESLDAFLAQEKTQVARVFEDYNRWLESRGSKRFRRIPFDMANPGTAAFLRAARLHPRTTFRLVNRLVPEEKMTFARVTPDSIAPQLETKPPFASDFEDTTGQSVSIRSIMVTFVDEPDWWMDRQLFEIPEYGYGDQPYGKKTGESTKAAFHMQFNHENMIVRTFAPQVTQGMVSDRVELFLRLSRAAQASGHPYWAWRFAAWALHYYQDLTQPYHSRAVPHGNAMYYMKYVVSGEKPRIQKETTQLVANRHFAYEDFVSNSLYNFYRTKDALSLRLCRNLSEGDVYFRSVRVPDDLTRIVTSFAADHAPHIDSAIVFAFGPKITEDPAYDFETDPAYSVANVLAAMKREHADRLLLETGKDFTMAARATRTVVMMAK